MQALAKLRAELLATHHLGRLERMLELGRQAKRDPKALALVDELTDGDVFDRRLALLAQHTLRDGKRLLRFTEDTAQTVRSLAFTMVPRVCDDAEALEALKIAYTLRRERDLLRNIALRGRRDVVDRYLDWLAERPGLHDFADIVPWASPAGVRRHLDRALARPSQIFWTRLARGCPEALGGILCDRLRAVPGEPDAVTRQLIAAHSPQIAAGAPDVAIELIDILCARRIFSQVPLVQRLGRARPSATLALLERHDLRPGGAPFARSADKLTPAELGRLVRRDPTLLGRAEPLLDLLAEPQLAEVLVAWCDMLKDHPTWGFPLLGKLSDPQRRLQAYQRWSTAARNSDGIIAAGTVTQLPEDLRELEARRHLHEVIALGTRPMERIVYARFLPWDEALATLKAFLGFPEGGVRGLALDTMLAIPGLRPKETALPDKALAMITARKNEQDPVRSVMLRALVAWPRAVWRKDHQPVIAQILRDALDAGDLSHGTAQCAEALLIRTFFLDPAAGAVWLGTFIKERGNLYDARLGAHLTDADVRAAAPHLLAVCQLWHRQERTQNLMQLADSLGERMKLVDGLADILADIAKKTPWGYTALYIITLFARFDTGRYESGLAATLRHWFDKGWYSEILSLAARQERPGKRQPPLHPELAAALERISRGVGRDEHIVQAVTLLRVRAVQHFDRILPDLLNRDPSYVCIPVIHWHLHARRQDLLDPFLGDRVITGRFATGTTRWLLPFKKGFFRWTPAQNTTFAASLGKLVTDKDRDTPTIWSCLAVLAAMDSAPMDTLMAAAADTRPAIQEKAIRVMGRCDRGQCVPTLIGCLDDARARIAIYGLRSALRDMLPRAALHLLGGVPLRKVTVAKEVLRLLGELRIDAAYEHLVKLDATDLHRDVRIAMLRALWDHLDREPTWQVYARAVGGADWVMASRLGDIPADRLTADSDRRLSGLLGQVLARPEPEARIDLLRRAATLAVSDPERTFLRACSERLISQYDDEVKAAALAILHRSTEKDLLLLPELISRALADARCLHVAIDGLLSVPIRQRASWVQAIRAAEQVLTPDPRWIVPRLRCAAAAMDDLEFTDHLARLAEQHLLTPGALAVCQSAVHSLRPDNLEAVSERLLRSSSPAARRVALTAVVRDAGPERGWAPERLARLARLQADPDPALAGAALAVFPPREMAEKPRPAPEKK
jgi:hypothetical protein